MKNIQLELSIDQTNIILAALGKMPYADVFQLINVIQEQATAQINQSES